MDNNKNILLSEILSIVGNTDPMVTSNAEFPEAKHNTLNSSIISKDFLKIKNGYYRWIKGPSGQYISKYGTNSNDKDHYAFSKDGLNWVVYLTPRIKVSSLKIDDSNNDKIKNYEEIANKLEELDIKNNK